MKISVVMPVYNGEKYLKEAIESILTQTYKDFEFIIIDDGSIDNSTKIVENFSDNRINLLKLNHGGIVSALNEGLKIAKGEYIIRVDSDDISLSGRFEMLAAYMDKNINVAVCGSWANSINEMGKETGEMSYPPVQNKKIKKYAILHNPFIHPSVIIRRSALVKVGGYRNFKHAEDYELWTRILSQYEGHNVPEKLIRYRIHSNQVTNKSNMKMRLVGLLVRLLAVFRLIY